MSQPPITRRYGEGVPGRVTLRYPLGQAMAGAGTLAPGTVVAAGYRIEAGPLGPSSGEGDVYRCRLHGQGEPLILKLYRDQLRPDPQVMAQLLGLAHPNIVRILDQGQWQGHFFELMAYCAGGTLAEAMPFNELQLRDILAQVVAGLDYCHRRGIVHCDIKPANLFYADVERRRVCLGDFGISAHGDNLEATHITRNAGDLTLDYSAPELVDGGQASPKSDYYALGISLLELLRGRSPFAGKRPGEVMADHLRGRIPLPAGLSELMTLLVKGLTEFDGDRRWGFREVMAWLHGDLSQVAVDRHQRRARAPYPGYPQAWDCATLAANLQHFDALEQLRQGDIRRWLFDQVDAGLAEQVKPLEQLARRQGAQALLRLGFLLNPYHPLRIGDLDLRTLLDLMTLLAQQPVRLETAWNSGAIALWIESGQLAGGRTGLLAQRLREIEERHRGLPANALQALLFTLDPQRPLPLFDRVRLRHPGQLGEALRLNQKATLKALRHLIFSQLLEEWLRGAEFDHWQADCRFIERARGDYADRPQIGAYAVLWHFVARIPFPFAGQQVRDPQVLVSLVERSEQDRQEALRLLEEGWLRAWLVGAGLVRDPMALDQLLLTIDLSWDAKLESLLRLLAPQLPAPRLEVEPQRLTFPPLEQGGNGRRALTIRNRGRGHLHGRILLATYGQGISLGGFRFEGAETQVEVRLDTLGLPPGQYHNSLRLLSNGGEGQVAIGFYIKPGEEEKSWWQVLTE